MHDVESMKPADMLVKLNDDVKFAFDEYEEATKAEEKARKLWDRRQLLDESPPANPTRDEKKLLEEDSDFFKQRFKDRMRVRIKKKEIWDKRKLAKEKHKTDNEEVERKENLVYKEGDNYNVRWSTLPRFV